ncbi:ABC transporter ATP-binding protein [bacterium (candidate division B38) B3_B38]|nr:MAG: ABC transporter ATP-binding protein [bacterium (candidate division B38) B3_B38]
MNKILRTENLEKVYRVGKIDIHAVQGVNLGIEKGEFVSIVGPSGCGKSTLLHLMGGMAKPTTGRVFIEGIDISTISDVKRAKIRREKIGFVFQRFNLFSALSSQQNLEIAMQICRNGNVDHQRIKEIMALVGLENKLHHKPLELSMGEQQRVAIARALVNDPLLILADEPTGNLDSENSYRVLYLLKDLNRNLGQTIVLITHNQEASKIADRKIKMKDGMVISPS